MITLLKNRQWLIPATDDDMKLLLKLNLRLTKFDVDFLPMLRLMAKTKGEKVQVKDFYVEVFDPMLKKLESFWTKTDGHIIKYDKNRIKLIARYSKESVQKLRVIENKLLAFFERWGYATEFIPSESKTRASLTIDYILEKEKMPLIIQNDREHEPDFNPAIMEFGSYRFIINKHNDCYGFSFEEKIGAQWEIVRSVSKVNLKDIKTSRFVSVLFELFNMQSIK